jgi:hypothetical protein
MIRLRTIRWKADRMSAQRLMAAQALAIHRLREAGAFVESDGFRWDIGWLSDHEEVAE